MSSTPGGRQAYSLVGQGVGAPQGGGAGHHTLGRRLVEELHAQHLLPAGHRLACGCMAGEWVGGWVWGSA
jgi:hypothetical protein